MIYSLWTCFSVPLFHVPNTFNFDFIETKVYFEWCDFLFLFLFFLLRFLHSHSINANKVKNCFRGKKCSGFLKSSHHAHTEGIQTPFHSFF